MKKTSFILLLVLFLTPLFFRTFFESKRLISEAREYKADKNYDLAVENYRQAITWKGPLGIWGAAAETELRDLIDSGVVPDLEDAKQELKSALNVSKVSPTKRLLVGVSLLSWISFVIYLILESAPLKLKQVFMLTGVYLFWCLALLL